MIIWRVEVKEKEGIFDALGEGVHKDILGLGVTAIDRVRLAHVYRLRGTINEAEAKTVAEELLVDRVSQEYRLGQEGTLPVEEIPRCRIVEVAYHPGVMDPVEESTIKGINDLGIKGVEAVHTAKKYYLFGRAAQKDIDLVVDKVLANKLIQHVVDPTKVAASVEAAASPVKQERVLVLTVDILSAKDRDLIKLSTEGQLFLNLAEMKAVQDHFKKLDRNPTDCELETIAQTWSEHCHHKTFRGRIEYTYTDGKKKRKKVIKNLLKSTIMKATKELNKPWCVSVFHDNSGVIRFDQDYDVCFKVETHNHPSALEPFGGANTGIGGVIRDVLGTGLGAKPIANTDIFCFAPPDFDNRKLPAGTLHPKRVMKGVVAGVRDYGNKMGIPTVNGAIIFDDGYVGNPLVYCGNAGLIPRGKEKKKVAAGDLVVVAGGRTGRDGIHGATFSSGELTSESEVVSSGAVQIGDPIQEKKVLDVLLKARDRGLYSAITDCGAGGLSSAVGEMGETTGARVALEKVPLKYRGITYREIWISESQERMVMSVPPSKIEALLAVFAEENVEATVIGDFPGTGRLELSYHNVKVADLDMRFLHDGIPDITKKASWRPARLKEPTFSPPKDLTKSLLSCLAHYNVCSKEWVIRQYDHEVQGGSVIKPLVGIKGDGPSDASIVAPRMGRPKGVILANGINARYGMVDPFWMAASCIDEAIRQVIAVGGRRDQVALLDNFCWGNPDKPDRLGGLVRAAEACYKFSVGYGVPFISGKDSLYNEYNQAGRSRAIPGTILISALGIMDDITKAVTMDFKEAGNSIYLVGKTADELGGSIYYDRLGFLGSQVPQVDVKQGARIFDALSAATGKRLVRAMHDCSEGGLGVAVAEMAFGGGLGASIALKDVPCQGRAVRNDTVFFSESNSRFVVEVRPEERKKFERVLVDVPHAVIGQVERSPGLAVTGLDGKICVNASLADLKEAWQRPLRW